MKKIKDTGVITIYKLSFAEENFLQLVVSGLTSLDAVKRAYPKVAEYPKDKLQKKIYNIYQKPGVRDREAVLQEEFKEVLKKRGEWDINMATHMLKDVISANMGEIQRSMGAFEEQERLMRDKIKEIEGSKLSKQDKKMEISYWEDRLMKMQRQPRIDKGSNTAIINSISEINRIHKINDPDKGKGGPSSGITFIGEDDILD